MNLLIKINPLRKKKNIKYMIFYHARAGSTILMNILNFHSDVNIYSEPFHGWKFIKKRNLLKFIPGEDEKPDNISDMPDIEKSLKKISIGFNGIKQSMMQLNKKLNTHIILRKDISIVYLHRKNILQTIISLLISRKIKYWSHKPDIWREKFEKENFKTFDIEEIRKRMNKLIKDIRFYKNKLVKNNVKFLELYYEDLFGNDITDERKIDIINEIFKFFKLEQIKDPDVLNEIKELLNPDTNKLNSEETYKKIPNIMEIEKELGCDETGWLFK